MHCGDKYAPAQTHVQTNGQGYFCCEVGVLIFLRQQQLARCEHMGVWLFGWASDPQAHLDILIQNAGLQLHILVNSTNHQYFIIFRQSQDICHCSTVLILKQMRQLSQLSVCPEDCSHIELLATFA